MSYTRCQDRNCPLQFNCIRYDAKPMPDLKTAYFASSPRNRDQCQFYFPHDHTQRPTPLTADGHVKPVEEE